MGKETKPVEDIVGYSQIVTRQQRQYTVTYQQHNGRRHMVLPVVIMVEGVHSGSAGPVFHSSSELSRFPGCWDGIPVVINHPSDNGNPISANSPEIIERQSIGRVYHTYWDNGALRSEVWVDETLIQSREPALHAHLLAGLPMDVSMGAYSDDVEATGNWNGETYRAVAHNYRPDHLALLPRSRGACSWSDGCGIRANEYIDGGGSMDKALWQGLFHAGLRVEPMPADATIQSNALGYREVSGSIQRKLDTLDNEAIFHYLEEVYDGEFVYRVENRETSATKLYRRSYTMPESGQLAFGDDVVPVVKRVEYVEQPQSLQQNSEPEKKLVRTKKVETDMKTNSQNDCGCPTKVDSLLKTNHFKETDRVMLEALPNDTLDRLLAIHEEIVEPKEPKVNATPPDPKPAPVPQMNEEQILAALSPERRRQMEYGLKRYQEDRLATVRDIVANSNSAFTEKDLEAYSDEQLEKLSKAIPRPADYSLAGSRGAVVTNAGEAPLLPVQYGVKEAK